MGNNRDPINVLIERRRMRITDKQIEELPLPLRKLDSNTAGKLDRRTKRLCVARQQVYDECTALAARKKTETNDWIQKQAFGKILDRIVELEVWQQFPELTGKPFVIYDDWCVGPEESRTGDLFRPFEVKGVESRARDTISTRSNQVRVYDFRYPLISPQR